MRRGRYTKGLFIAATLAILTFAQYSTDLGSHHFHLFYQALFFIPIILAGLWFGLKRALLVSIAITLILTPFTVTYWSGRTVGNFNNITEMILYNVIASIVGGLRDREQNKERRLQQSMRLAAMGEAASILAHDIKTPLISIGGYARWLRNHMAQRECQECWERIDIIIEESQRLEAMMGKILDFARPLQPEKSMENIKQVTEQALAIIDDFAQRKKITMALRTAPSLPFLPVDPSLMKQALINLLKNAIEASPEGEEVEIRAYSQHRGMLIEVRDHGCGLPLGRNREIFQPFFTTKREGTGLGLSVVQKIVEAHQGQIEVLPNGKKGSIFRISLPLHE